MNSRVFLKEFAESRHRRAAELHLMNEMQQFAANESITVDDISTDEIEQLAEGVFERGLSDDNRNS